MQAKPCRGSRVIKTNRVFPNDVNDHNTLFGGKPMSDAEDLRSADRRIAFLTFVAIDDAGLPARCHRYCRSPTRSCSSTGSATNAPRPAARTVSRVRRWPNTSPRAAPGNRSVGGDVGKQLVDSTTCPFHDADSRRHMNASRLDRRESRLRDFARCEDIASADTAHGSLRTAGG